MTPPAGYAKDYAVAVAVDLTGAITYTDGTIAFDDSGNYQYSSAEHRHRALRPSCLT